MIEVTATTQLNAYDTSSVHSSHTFSFYCETVFSLELGPLSIEYVIGQGLFEVEYSLSPQRGCELSPTILSMPFLDPAEPFTFEIPTTLEDEVDPEAQAATSDGTPFLGIETGDYYLSGSSLELELYETSSDDDSIF